MESRGLYSIKNPFGNIDANDYDEINLLGYWCEPYEVPLETLFHERTPIVVVGSRGTGKTMVLRYISYDVQRLKVPESDNLVGYFSNLGAICSYFRMISYFAQDLTGHDYPQKKWDEIFIHYFELSVCQKYLSILCDLLSDSINMQKIEIKAIQQLKELFEIHEKVENIAYFTSYISSLIKDIEAFKIDVAYSNVTFQPKILFTKMHLISSIVSIIKNAFHTLSTASFIIVLDEYENYSYNQQRIINNYMKFTDFSNGITFRIGMRPAGFITKETLVAREDIEEGNDYICVTKDETNCTKEYQELLKKISKTRLSKIAFFKDSNLTDICEILGTSEDLDSEANACVNGGDKHFNILRSINVSEDEIYQLKCTENTEVRYRYLCEMYNTLLYMRGIPSKYIKDAMNDYFLGKYRSQYKNELGEERWLRAKKYYTGFTTRYKLSLMYLLNQAYRKNKKYYSFKTFAHLSSGSIRNFILLCNRVFCDYRAISDLIHLGNINIDIQNDAVKATSNINLSEIRKYDYGEEISSMTNKLGNVFRQYQTDILLRYPELNHFAINGTLSPINKEVIRVAINIGAIQMKPNIRRIGIKSRKGQLYVLNRIFSPEFGITYRIRGNSVEEYDDKLLDELFDNNKTSFKPTRAIDIKQAKKRATIAIEMSLYKATDNAQLKIEGADFL